MESTRRASLVKSLRNLSDQERKTAIAETLAIVRRAELRAIKGGNDDRIARSLRNYGDNPLLKVVGKSIALIVLQLV